MRPLSRERIGYVFQTFNLMRGFSALENVLLAMRFTGRRADRKRARHLLGRVGLDHRITHRPAHAFRRRAAAGGGRPGAGQRPKILLADEPTANVDAGHQQQVLDLLRQTCREENVALVLVTHSPEVAAAIRPRRAFGGVQSRGKRRMVKDEGEEVVA